MPRARTPGVQSRPADRPPEFLSDLLDDLSHGTIELSVPLRDDVIQVGARDVPITGTVRVCKKRRTVTVRRTDGKPLQVDFIRQPATSADGLDQGAITDTLVFRPALTTLLLQRRRDAAGRPSWQTAGMCGVADVRLIKQFVDTVATFGLAKQRPSRRWQGVIRRLSWQRGRRRFPE